MTDSNATGNPKHGTRNTERETRNAKFDLRALYETSQLLGASLDLDFVLSRLLLTAMSKLLVTRAAAFLYDSEKETYRLAAARGLPGLAEGEHLALPDGVVCEIQRGDEVPAPLREHGFVLALPIVVEEQPVGLVALGRKGTGGDFDPAEREFVASLVHLSAAAVRNARLVQELRTANRDLDARVRELDTLFDLSRAFNATRERDRLLKLLAYALMGQMGVRRYLFLLAHPDEEESVLQVEAARDMEPPEPALRDQLADLEETLLLQDDDTGEWTALRERDVALALPIQREGRTQALLCLGPKLSGAPYEDGDLTFLDALAHLALVSVRNTYLVEGQIEKERLEEEVRLARSIQERLVPEHTDTPPGTTLAACSYPSRRIGGDYFDVIPLDDNRTLLAIADVTGKGVPASLLMANLQACLHTLLPMDLPPDAIARHVNRVICKNTASDKFITFFCGIYDADANELCYVNAGHNPPVLLRASGEVEVLEAGGLLLGVMSGAPYEAATVSLDGGDVLALFTDGVVEAMNDHDEEYGRGRLEDVLRTHADSEADTLREAILEDVRAFAGQPQYFDDDLTMIVLRRDE